MPHRKLVSVHANARHGWEGKVEGRDPVAQAPGKREHKATQAAVHMEGYAAAGAHGGDVSHMIHQAMGEAGAGGNNENGVGTERRHNSACGEPTISAHGHAYCPQLEVLCCLDEGWVRAVRYNHLGGGDAACEAHVIAGSLRMQAQEHYCGGRVDFCKRG